MPPAEHHAHDGAASKTVMTAARGRAVDASFGRNMDSDEHGRCAWTDRLADFADLPGVTSRKPRYRQSEEAERENSKYSQGARGRRCRAGGRSSTCSDGAQCGLERLGTAPGSAGSNNGWVVLVERCPKQSPSAKRSAWSRPGSWRPSTGGPVGVAIRDDERHRDARLRT